MNILDLAILKKLGGGGGNANIDVTAEVGQTIIVKEVDENGKPTKWESAEYQKKICGDELGYVIPETSSPEFLVDALLVEGKTYVVNWEGVDYTCECFRAVGEDGLVCFCVGNRIFADGVTDTGEPFCILTGVWEGMLLGVATAVDETVTTFTFSVKGVVPTPIPLQFVTNAFPLYIEATCEPNPNGGINYPVNYVFKTSAFEVSDAVRAGREVKLRLQLAGELGAVVYNFVTVTYHTGTPFYLFALPYSDYGNTNMVAGLLVGYVHPFLQVIDMGDGTLARYSD